MTVRVTKPEINVREKLKELDFTHVPYEKMPVGSVIQTKYMKSNSGASFSSTSYAYTWISMDYSPKFTNSKLHLNLNTSYWMSSSASYMFTKVTQTIAGVESDVAEWKDNYQNAYPWAGMQNFETIYAPNTIETITFKWYIKVQNAGAVVYFPNDFQNNTGDKLMFVVQEIKQ